MRIPPVQKLAYLMSSLTKNVRLVIAGYAITNENYPLVVKALKDEFGDPKAIKEALQSDLINLPAPFENVQSLKAFVNSLERICRQLELKSENNDGFLLSIIKSKLPMKVLEHVLKAEKSSKTWNLDELRKSLIEYVSFQVELERCINLGYESRNSFENTPPKKDFRHNNRVENARTFALLKMPTRGISLHLLVIIRRDLLPVYFVMEGIGFQIAR
jgi:hypothetical protein